jgi:hypothetical protein
MKLLIFTAKKHALKCKRKENLKCLINVLMEKLESGIALLMVLLFRHLQLTTFLHKATYLLGGFWELK